MPPSIVVLFALVASVGCTITVPPKADKPGAGEGGAPVCCRTDPDAAAQGCLCEPASTNIVVVSGATCSVSTTLNGQVIDFTGISVSTCN